MENTLRLFTDGAGNASLLTETGVDKKTENDVSLLLESNGSTPFPDEKTQIVISDFQYKAERMGDTPTITATVYYKKCLDDLWTDRVYTIFNGEKYYIMNTPSSSKNNEDERYEHSLEMLSEREVLNHVYFIDAVQDNPEIDIYQTNSSKVQFTGDIKQFVARLNYSLAYAKLDYTVVVDEGIETEDKDVNFEDLYITSVLQEGFNIFNVPYYFEGKTIHYGFTSNVIPNVFKYGFNDALLSISKENAKYDIVRRCSGVGSSDNIPYYYPNITPVGTAVFDVQNIEKDKVDINMSNVLKTNSEFDSGSYVFCAYGKNQKAEVTTSAPLYDGEKLVSNSGVEENVTILQNFNGKRIKKNFSYKVYALKGSVIDFSAQIFNVKVKSGKATVKQQTEDVYISSWDDAIEDIKSDIYRVVDNSYQCVSDGWIRILVNVVATVYSKENTPAIVAFTPFSPFNVISYRLIHTDSYFFEFGRSAKNIDYKDSGISFLVDDKDTLPHKLYNMSFENGEWIKGKNEGSQTPVTINITEREFIRVSDKLMPPIYRESKGAERFYNAANDTYPNTEGGYYHFENLYIPTNPGEKIVSFNDIKPTIKGMKNAEGLRMDMFSEFAFDENDNDEKGEDNYYIHPYFFGKLRKFDGTSGFNLFDHAIENQEMTISMTSGVCGACSFTIGVDDETQKNMVQVDDSGNLKRDESGDVICGRDGKPAVTAQDKQQDTVNNEVWIALKKDENTYGQIMPNRTQNLRPSPNDTFVILGINLPQSYITAAEERLKDAIIKYMFENNSEKFTFSVSFSRIYFKENPDVLAMLNENSRITVEYNGNQYQLYVSSFTYDVSSDEALPEISVELMGELSSTTNSLQNVIDNVKDDILSTVSSMDIVGQGTRYFLRKDIQDKASQIITFLEGLLVGGDLYGINKDGTAIVKSLLSRKFQSGHDNGFGFGIGQREDGTSYVETDELLVRKKAIFRELEIRKLSYVAGDFVFSNAGSTITRVVPIDADGNEVDASSAVNYRCYIENDNGTTATMNAWDIDDQAKCQTFNIAEGVYENVSNTYYWRRVMSVGADYIDLSVTDCDADSDVPKEGDVIVQEGNRTNTERQNIIIIKTSGDNAPAIEQYDGINSYSLVGKRKTVISPKGNEFYAKRFTIVTEDGEVPVVIYKGDWSASNTYYYYEQVSHNGSLWLCVAPEGTGVTSEPSDSNPQWKKQTEETQASVELVIDTNGYSNISYGERIKIKASLFKGSSDISNTVTKWSITRDTGNTEADATWNSQAQIDSTGVTYIEWSESKDDFGSENQSASFTIEAIYTDANGNLQKITNNISI